jgi:hypothetical protein
VLLAARATGLPNPSVANVTELVTLDRALRTFFTIAAGLPPVAIEYMEGTPDWPPMLAVAHTAAYDVALTSTRRSPPTASPCSGCRCWSCGAARASRGSAETARHLADAVTKAELVTLPGQPHSPAPEALAPELVPFFLG